MPHPPWEDDPDKFPPEIMEHFFHNKERESLDLPPGGGESPSAGSGSHHFEEEEMEEHHQVGTAISWF